LQNEECRMERREGSGSCGPGFGSAAMLCCRSNNAEPPPAAAVRAYTQRKLAMI